MTEEEVAFVEKLIKTPREEREQVLRSLPQEEIERIDGLFKEFGKLLEQTEAALKEQLSVVEARGEQLRANLEYVASFVKPKGKA